MSPRGRFAPSPTGEMHLGNASSALVAWLSVRSRGGAMVLRMEDLDRNRARPALADQVLDDLQWLGLDWDEGPDVGGPLGPYDQQSRLALYRAAFDRLRDAGRLYPCFCSRKEIAAAISAPQEPGDEAHYAGACRELEPEAARARIATGARHAWRFRVASNTPRPEFDDLCHGGWAGDSWPCGDFVVWRSDEVPAYQLAVVVDDAAMRIDEVVRGDDLLASTRRQLLLHGALGSPAPSWGHVPLLLGPDGARLSKRHQGITLRELRQAGLSAEQIVGRLAFLLGLVDRAAPASAKDLIADFRWSLLVPRPEGIVIDHRRWV